MLFDSSWAPDILRRFFVESAERGNRCLDFE